MDSKTWAKLETRKWLAIRSVINLALAYLFASLAIDTGSLLQYALTILFAIMGIRNAVQAIKKGHGTR